MARARQKRREDIHLNLTALIDVLFLLLMFFMATTTFTKNTRLSIVLPEAQGQPSQEEPNSIAVGIGAQGAFSVNDVPLANTQADTLKKALQLAAVNKNPRESRVILTADGAASHQSVVTAMDVAGQLGFANITIATREPDAP
jgi:biopolymer transport protein ExbD